MTLTVAPFDKVKARRLPAEQRREHLLDVGAAIILDSGFETLNMESVGERAGVARRLPVSRSRSAPVSARALATHTSRMRKSWRWRCTIARWRSFIGASWRQP